MNPRRLVISDDVRERVVDDAMDAAFEANGERELSYTTEKLIRAAVGKTIEQLEFALAFQSVAQAKPS